MSSDVLIRTSVDFLRHGQAQGGNYFRGVTDDPLSELGWQQMFQQCSGKRWDVIIASPLRRCASFAAAWSQEHRTQLVVMPEWREMDFGEWEGQTAEQISNRQPEALARFYENPAEFSSPHAEAYSEFVARIQQAWQQLLAEFAGRHILVVTHAGVIRALFSSLLAISPRQSMQIEIPHACMTRFTCFDDAAGRFVQLNFHKPV